jgi:hypothetical protein
VSRLINLFILKREVTLRNTIKKENVVRNTLPTFGIRIQ